MDSKQKKPLREQGPGQNSRSSSLSINNYTSECFNSHTNLRSNIESFLIRCQSLGHTAGTIQFYRVKFKKLKSYCDDHNILEINQLTAEDIRKYFLFLKDCGHNPGGLNCFYRALRTLLNWYETEYEPTSWSNPISKVKAPKINLNPLEPISLESIKRLLETCSERSFTDIRDRAIILFLLDTGLRANELLQINLEDIDLDKRHCHVRAGKGGRSRIAILGEVSIQAVISYIEIRTQPEISALWITHPRFQAKRLKYSGLRSMLRRRATKAGIDAPTIHSFRRAFAMTLLREEVNIYTLAKLMGHASIDTLKFYLKHTIKDIEQAHRQHGPVDNVLFKKSPESYSDMPKEGSQGDN